MFGYVVPNQAALSDEAQKRYRTAYCGLCRRIDALHGLRGRFTLSYDLTFLNLLLCSLYEGETEASSGHDRCPIHPLGGVEWRAASPTDYCADLSVALHYYNAEDKWTDDRSLLGLGYEKLLTGCKQAAESRWPRQCSAIRTCLDRLAEYEAAGSEDLDAVSGCFGELMAQLLVYREDMWAKDLGQMGFSLGRFIYLLDAAADYDKDKRKGKYNPYLAMGMEKNEKRWEEYLVLAMGRCAERYEKLPLVQDKALLDNILYSGVWVNYRGKRKEEAANDG